MVVVVGVVVGGRILGPWTSCHILKLGRPGVRALDPLRLAATKSYVGRLGGQDGLTLLRPVPGRGVVKGLVGGKRRGVEQLSSSPLLLLLLSSVKLNRWDQRTVNSVHT